MRGKQKKKKKTGNKSEKIWKKKSEKSELLNYLLSADNPSDYEENEPGTDDADTGYNGAQIYWQGERNESENYVNLGDMNQNNVNLRYESE